MNTWSGLKIFLQSLRKRNLPPMTLLVEIGRCFLGNPYQANLLERQGKEKLIHSFDAFDCLTFVETVLSLNAAIKSGVLTRDGFREKLKLIRYRNGFINGYASRLHYTLEWIADNEKKKILRNITCGLPGAVKFKKEINFISTHGKLYPQLADLRTHEAITATEKNLSRQKHLYIPKKDVSAAFRHIGSGDIVAFTAQADGLYIAHIGFAIREKGELHLLHASSKEGAVVISEKTIVSYLKQNKIFSGIIVVRLA
jgi:hypothetical protein